MTDEELSKLASRIRLQQEGTPEREAWLERLREEVRAGRYHVDAETLADTLMERVFTRTPRLSQNENEV
jgi:anti-sigma28 factor (negative regulator of flagellin synthesis)